MSVARIAVLALAAAAAVFVALYVRNLSAREASGPSQAAVSTVSQTSRVLAAKRDVPVGRRLTPEDLTWTTWPKDAVTPVYIEQTTGSGALESMVGAVARTPLTAGEPITRGKIVNPGEGGFMAAVIEPGARAVSVPISVETAAGGFILPGDRVDVIVTRRVEIDMGNGRTQETTLSDTIMQNVRVLAIDQRALGEYESETIVGGTATLELVQEDAEIVALGARVGEITLALRSVVDEAPGDGLAGEGAVSRATGRGLGPGSAETLKIYRFGEATSVSVRGDK